MQASWSPNSSQQSVLNAAARLIAYLPPYSNICAHMINDLCWLPILAPTRYKVLLFLLSLSRTLAPKYLCDLMCKPLSVAPLNHFTLLMDLILVFPGHILRYASAGLLLQWVPHFGVTLVLQSGV